MAIMWNDEEYPEHRPESVDVSVVVNGKLFDTQTLSEENDWKYTYEQVSADDTYEVASSELEYYTMVISGTTITYTYTEPEPSIEERLDAVEELAEETFETVDTIMSDIIPELEV